MATIVTSYGYIIIFYVNYFVGFLQALDTTDIVFVVLSQSDKYHATKAAELKEDILLQVSTLKKDFPAVRLINEEFPHVGAWTVTPLMPWLVDLHDSDSLWVMFLEERTKVNVSRLIIVLEKYDPNEAIWMGHALFDEESTIIHHFAFSENPSEFKYPLFASGFVTSMNLLRRLVKRNENRTPKSDFSIDASHELALYIGKPLLNLPHVFCLEKNEDCVSYPVEISSCGYSVPKEDIFFAVKTCLKFHNDRVPIIKKTWGKEVKHIEFFSHYQDKIIPTTDVGIENTERGHCAKTFAIFRLTLDRSKYLPVRWLFLADDDTILSVARVQEILSCWNSSEPIAIGERYGYNVKDMKLGGYNYLTGGGGIAISLVTIPLILQHCACQQIDAPDDMYLGICLARLDIPVIHSPDFHQARPNDYATGYVDVQKPVSFHKHWMIDPVSVYNEWFGPVERMHRHGEL